MDALRAVPSVRCVLLSVIMVFLAVNSHGVQPPDSSLAETNSLLEVDAFLAVTETNDHAGSIISNEPVGQEEKWNSPESSTDACSRRHVNVRTVIYADGSTRVEEAGRGYTELAGGLNYRTQNGEWKLSTLGQDVQADGSIAYTQLAATLNFANNANQNAVVEIRHAGGKVARSAVAGLSYYDSASGKSYVFAWLKNSSARRFDGGVYYPDAFEGAGADIRYKVDRVKVQQDVVLYSLPNPTRFGMNPKSTWLSVLTELLDADLAVADVWRDDLAKPEDRNEAPLEVWSLSPELVRNRPYNFQRSYTYVEEGDWVVGGEAPSESSPVAAKPQNVGNVEPLSMRIFEAGGRVFLSEDVPVSAIRQSAGMVLSAGGEAAASGIPSQGWPAAPPERPTQMKSVIAATRARNRAAFVVDYCNYYGTYTNNVRFYKDQTYFISSDLVVSGAKLTIEPGTVVKLATNASIILQSAARLECLYYTNQPAIFTSAHDTSAGEAIPGYTNAPVSNKYVTALNMQSGTNRVWGLQIRYAKNGLVFNAPGAEHDVRDTQVLDSDRAVKILAGWSVLRIRHVLVSNVLEGVWARTNSPNVTFCTFDNVGSALWITSGVASLTVSDCLFVDVATNLVSNGVVSVGFNCCAAFNATNGWLGTNAVTLASRPFEPGVQGAHYLLRSATNLIDHGSGQWPYTANWYHHTTATNHAKESNTVMDIGFHYPSPVDSDLDGLCDYWEDAYANASYWSVQDESNWQNADTDGDGLSDGSEVRLYWTNPKAQDSDSDGQNDKQEVDNGSDPNSAASFLTTLSGTVAYSGSQTGMVRITAYDVGSVSRDGLILEYLLDGDGGSNITDQSEGGNSASVSNATYSSSGYRDGCYLFNGTNSCLHITYSATNSLHPVEDPFTVSAWFKTSSSTPLEQTVVATHYPGTAANGYYMSFESGGGHLRWFVGASNRNYVQVYSTNVLNDGQWHHAVGLWSSNQIYLYIDGQLNASREANGSVLYNYQAPFRIGHMKGIAAESKYFFNGSIDEVRIYSRALGTNEIACLYNKGILNRTAAIATPSSFAVTNIPTGSYFVNAYRDRNGNTVRDMEEPYGVYSGNPVIVTGATSGVNITLSDPDSDGDGQSDWQEMNQGTDPQDGYSFMAAISGSLDYSGGQTGAFRVVAETEANLVLHQDFLENDFAKTRDKSGLMINGSVIGPVWTNAGYINGTYQFGATSSHRIDLGRPPVLCSGLSTQFTLSVWINPDLDHEGYIVGRARSAYNDLSLYINDPDAQGINYTLKIGSTEYFLWSARGGVSNVPNGAWTHVVSTYSGTQLVGYINGRPVDSTNITGIVYDGTNNWLIGNRHTLDRHFRGRIDEAKVYQRALSPLEVTNLYLVDHSDVLTGFTTVLVGSATSYALTNTPTLSSYSLRTWLDSDGNGTQETAEAEGSYSNNPILLQAPVTNANMELVDPDSDGDGMPDWWEAKYGFDPDDPEDADDDPDEDSMPNIVEYQSSSNPFEPDSDYDGMPDGWECEHGMNPVSGLSGNMAAWYRFNEGAGFSISNAVSGGYTGSLYNASATNWIQGYTGGSNDYSLWFDGVNDYVGIPQNPAIFTQAPFSVSAWVWHAGAVEKRWGSVVSDSGWNSPHITGYLLRNDTNVNWTGWYVGCSTNHGQAGRYNWKQSYTGRWVHLASTYNGTNLKFYTDGALSQTGTGVFSAVRQAQCWIGLGHVNANTSHWRGAIDDVRFYRSELNTQEVAALYEGRADADIDGLSNLTEYQLGTNPLEEDTDGDGLSDEWEIQNSLNPTDTDTDSDGIDDGTEVFFSSNPTNSPGTTGINRNWLFHNASGYSSPTWELVPGRWERFLMLDQETGSNKVFVLAPTNLVLDSGASNLVRARFSWSEGGGYPEQYSTGQCIASVAIDASSLFHGLPTMDSSTTLQVYQVDWTQPLGSEEVYFYYAPQILSVTGLVTLDSVYLLQKLLTNDAGQEEYSTNNWIYGVQHYGPEVYGRDYGYWYTPARFNNGGFEDGPELWTNLPYWTSFGTNAGISSSIKQGGSSHSFVSRGDAGIYQNIRVYPGEELIVSGYLYTPASTNAIDPNPLEGNRYGLVAVEYLDAPGQLGASVIASYAFYATNAPDVWHEFAITSLVPDHVISANISLRAVLPRWEVSDNGHVYFDSLSVSVGNDADRDGMPSWWEAMYGMASNVPADSIEDMDEDGLRNIEEYRYGTNPTESDTDGDGISDLWELYFGFNPGDPSDGGVDSDGDELTNLQEYEASTAPWKADTDGDGLSDGQEVLDIQSDPRTADFDGYELVQTISGADTSLRVGDWVEQGSTLASVGRRGYVEYALDLPGSEIYRVELVGADAADSRGWRSFPFRTTLDGNYLDRGTLWSFNGSNGTYSLMLPWATAGVHTIRYLWDNVEPDMELGIVEVNVYRLDGPDTNANGVGDWIDRRLDRMSGFDAPAVESLVSPACIEGRETYVPLMSVSTGILYQGAGARWYAA